MLRYDNESVKERICEFRKFCKATQADMAEYLGMKRTAYQRLETIGNFSWEHIELLADFFNVSPIFLRYGIEDHELRSISKMLKSGKATAFKDATFTIFDDLEEKENELSDYAAFISLSDIDKKRITDYMQENNL